MNSDNPCHNCPDRDLCCHDGCKKHKLWKSARQAREKYLRKEEDTRGKVLAVHRNAVEKATKGRK